MTLELSTERGIVRMKEIKAVLLIQQKTNADDLGAPTGPVTGRLTRINYIF